jgi:hypothetical protein
MVTSLNKIIEVAKFTTLNRAKKFLKDIKKKAAKGLIFVNGKPLKLTKKMSMDFGESHQRAKT